MVRRSEDWRQARFPAGAVVARGMLLLYLLLSGTLDLHHNHCGPLEPGTPALVAEVHVHAPCPVDLFQNAHGPAVGMGLPLGSWMSHAAPPLPQDQPWPGDIRRQARPRAPPVSA